MPSNTNLSPVSVDTLRKNILQVTRSVEAEIARQLPEKFGLIFDGWTHDNEHYLAIFATYEVDGSVHTPLLSMAPVVNEPNDNHSAGTHSAAIETVLGFFGTSREHCVFLVGDNCSVNKKLARLMDVPLVGYASHRLNLAVKLLTETLDTELEMVQHLMIKLRTLNQAAKVRFKTELHPVLRQDTRWGSTFKMVDRYFALLEFMDREDDEIADLLPTATANKRLTLLKDMKNIESVSKRIQTETVSMWEVRTLFDALIALFPQFEGYLGVGAAIVADPAFEAAIVKIQGSRQHLLSRAEKHAVRAFAHELDDGDAGDEDLSFAERALKRARSSTTFAHANAVAPTSNGVERLFSQARVMVGLQRHGLQPIMLEALLFLKINRSYWNAQVPRERRAPALERNARVVNASPINV